MKNNVFYLSARSLEAYLKKYDRGLNTKDYEYHIALYAHAFYEERLKQEFVIAYEVNDKPHNYPRRMGEINIEVLKDIIQNHFKENTDVDFVLAPRINAEEGKVGYPFQLKKFVAEEDVTSSGAAEYINEKANRYHNNELTMIVIPVNKVDRDVQKGLDINELKSKLKINDNALFAVLMFQSYNGKAILRPIWLSTRAKAFTASRSLN